jgi:hypothetical protein
MGAGRLDGGVERTGADAEAVCAGGDDVESMV